MKHGSLFSGIGGFDLAAEWMGWENVFQVEWDGYCQKVLAKNFPNVKRYGDIKEFDGTKYRGLIDIISGGFPCQPFSQAGKRKGKEDDRYLWPEMLRIIGEAKPSFIVGENVAGLVSMENGKTLDRILSDLENEGYTTEQIIIPACAVGAWHRRDRIWIIAYNNDSRNRTSRSGVNRNGEEKGKQWEQSQLKPCGYGKDVSDSNLSGLQEQGAGQQTDRTGQLHEVISDTQNKRFKAGRECNITERQIRTARVNDTRAEQWESEPSVGRVANGIPNRVDRLKGLGNAIVPQVAYEIFKAIEQYNEVLNNQL